MRILSIILIALLLVFSSAGQAAFRSYPPKWTPSGDRLIMATDSKTILIMESDASKVIREIKIDGELSEYLISPVGGYLLYVAKYEGLVKVNIETGEKIKLYDGPCGNVSWSPDGKNIIYSVVEISDNPGRKIVTYIVNIDNMEKKVIHSQVIITAPLMEYTTGYLLQDTTGQLKQ